MRFTEYGYCFSIQGPSYSSSTRARLICLRFKPIQSIPVFIYPPFKRAVIMYTYVHILMLDENLKQFRNYFCSLNKSRLAL